MTVVVAAHDEADRIGATLAALAEAFPSASLWVADDGSTDATAAIAAAAGAHVVAAGRVIGKGGAMTLAARAARARAPAATWLLCDGDLGASAAALGPLVDAVTEREADLAVAAFARRVGGGLGLARGFARWSIERRCGLRVRAPISGQRALSAATLEDVLPFARGYGMELGMTIDAVRAGRRVVEIELALSHRASGRTPAGFAHRARQLVDFVPAHVARGRRARAWERP